MIASGVLPLGHPGANPGMLLRRQQMPALHVVQGFHGQPFEAPDTAQRGTVQPIIASPGDGSWAFGSRMWSSQVDPKPPHTKRDSHH